MALMRWLAATVPLLILVSPSVGDDRLWGKYLAEVNCAGCHAIEKTGDSPMADAPPFRSIHQHYDEGELEDAFNDGVASTHPAMPDWDMTSDQARQLAAYIMSFQDSVP